MSATPSDLSLPPTGSPPPGLPADTGGVALRGVTVMRALVAGTRPPYLTYREIRDRAAARSEEIRDQLLGRLT